MDDGIVGQYLSETRRWQQRLGEQTMLLLQVGSFYEVYALLGDDEVYEGGDAPAFSRINCARIVQKGVARDGRRIMMSGFGIAQVEVYTQRLVDHGYTVVLFTQDHDAPGTTRSLSRIVSPGTTLSTTEEAVSNVLYCAWVRRCGGTRLGLVGTRVLAGAALDVHTGETRVFQVECEDRHDPVVYDELERQIAVHSPSECIVIHNLAERGTDIAGYMGFQGAKLHVVEEGEDSELGAKAVNAAKQIYQDEALARYYGDPGSIVADMERGHDLGIQALVFLLDFAHMHNPGLTERLSQPSLSTRPGRLVMGNHSLAQLNVIGDRRHEGRLSSVTQLLNQCVTPMGRRRFARLLATPITCPAALEDAYQATDAVNESKVGPTYKAFLQEVMDVQKIMRKLALGRLAPRDITGLLQSAHALVRLAEVPRPTDLPEGVLASGGALDAARLLIEHLESEFNMDKLAVLDGIGTEELGRLAPAALAIAQPGRCAELDALVEACTQGRGRLQAVADALGAEIAKTEKGANRKGPYVHIHETAKLPPTLTSTARRMHNLRARLKDMPVLSVAGIQLCVKSLEYTKQTGSRHAVTSPQIRDLARGSQEANDKLVACVRTFWFDALKRLGAADLVQVVEQIGGFAAEADVLQCRAYVASRYSYCRPTLAAGPRAFFEAQGLRHPLIEHLSEKEVYVTNDLALGSDKRGLLLYGTNAVGKTSLIRATGLAVVMAQAGLHVPCSSFHFRPYDAIYTRIIGNDNLFKGLSTFNVEMAELRVILKGANENSLILGDEVCSGTETGSAISIFATALEDLHRGGSTFLFATHLHEVTRFPEIQALDGLEVKHLQVRYEAQRDTLVYDRKLKDGPGEARYGLEVCKSLGLPEPFLRRAHVLRRKYAGTEARQGGVLDEPTSRFNAKKVRGNCEQCGEARATQVHHLQHQAEADKESGYIGGFHKNHPANLMSVCDACHDAFHESETQHRRVRTDKGYELAETVER